MNPPSKGGGRRPDGGYISNVADLLPMGARNHPNRINDDRLSVYRKTLRLFIKTSTPIVLFRSPLSGPVSMPSSSSSSSINVSASFPLLMFVGGFVVQNVPENHD